MKNMVLLLVIIFSIHVNTIFATQLELISVKSNGEPAGLCSTTRLDISHDGRYVVFSSRSRSIVEGDTARAYDVFLRDRLLQKTIFVSRDIDEGFGEESGFFGPSVSADGNIVAFTYSPGGGRISKAFAFDCLTEEIIPILDYHPDSVIWGWSPDVSANGQYIAYIGGGTFLHDLKEKRTEIVSLESEGQDIGSSAMCSVNADGRYIVFQAYSMKLKRQCIYVRDREHKTTTMVSVSSQGEPANYDSKYPYISDDGRYVLFQSQGDNLVPDDPHTFEKYPSHKGWDAFIHDCQTGETIIVPMGEYEADWRERGVYTATLNSNGRYVTFKNLIKPNSYNYGLFRYDRVLKRTSLLYSTQNQEESLGGAVSNTDGNTIAFLLGLYYGGNYYPDYDVYVLELGDDSNTTPTPSPILTPTTTPTPTLTPTITPTPTNTPTPFVKIYDEPHSESEELQVGSIDYDAVDHRNLSLAWNVGLANVRDWHVYVREGFGGMKFLGRTNDPTIRNFDWFAGADELNEEFVGGPEFNTIYTFRICGIGDEIGAENFIDLQLPVGFQREGGKPFSVRLPEGPDLSRGTFAVYDDIIGGDNLVSNGAQGIDVDAPNSRALLLAWNSGRNSDDVRDYHVYVKVDSDPYKFLGLTRHGRINYFIWSNENLFTTQSQFTDGPEGGHSYRFRVAMILFSGGVEFLQSGVVRYEVEE